MDKPVGNAPSPVERVGLRTSETVSQESRRSNQVGSPCSCLLVLPVLRAVPFAFHSWHPMMQVKAHQELLRDFQTIREQTVLGKLLEKCVGVLVRGGAVG